MPAFEQGTATNYRDLIDRVRDFATSNHVSVAVVAAGGTGYVVGEILTAVGGTSTTAATFEVLTESAGVILTVKIRQSGAYTVNPGNPVSTTGGGNGDATLTLTFLATGWTVQRDTLGAYLRTVVNIAAGGTGYAVSDVLTMDTSGVAGVTAATEATITVATVSAGVITSVTITTEGSYTTYTDVTPDAVPTTTGGGGTGATFDITLQPVTSGPGDGTENERELILLGTGSGSDTIYVGMRSYQDATARNWEIGGFTGFDSGLTWENQPGKSRGDFTNDTSGGTFVLLLNTSMLYWFNFNANRLIIVARAGTSYSSAYLGFLNPFASAAQYPYPLAVMGCCSDNDLDSGTTLIQYSGIADPIGHVTTALGPCQVRLVDGTWLLVRNSEISGSVRNEVQNVAVLPAGIPADVFDVFDEDGWWSSNFEFSNFVPPSGLPGDPTKILKTIIDSGGNEYWLIPCTVAAQFPSKQFLGEMDDVFWFSAYDGPTAEDTINTDFTVFQSGNRSEQWAHFAVRTSA